MALAVVNYGYAEPAAAGLGSGGPDGPGEEENSNVSHR